MSFTAQTPLASSAIAQTNLAFYKQLHAAGYDQAALLRMRDSYEFAIKLFAGHFRGSGKSFPAHLIGTASILASAGAASDVVTAGLLHAAYQQGDWGFSWRSRQRQRLRRTIGSGAEALVWRYFEMGWAPKTIRHLHANIKTLPDIDRAVILMRLANEVDDHLDLAMRHVDAAKDEYRELRDVFIAIAHAFDQPQLAAGLAEVYNESDDGAWASALSLGRKFSYRA